MDYPTLHQLGIGLVINLRFERPPLPSWFRYPLPTLWLPAFDAPFLFVPIRTLHRGVKSALQVIERGQNVYTHCAKGVHRSVALAACILIAQGHTPEWAVQLLKERRQAAEPEAWYVHRQILRFARAFHSREKAAG